MVNLGVPRGTMSTPLASDTCESLLFVWRRSLRYAGIYCSDLKGAQRGGMALLKPGGALLYRDRFFMFHVEHPKI